MAYLQCDGAVSVPGLNERWKTELCSLLEQSGMSELPRMLPPTILVLGNQRHCQERRAETIMSILGIKDWYLQGNNDTALTASPESDLVLTRYPIAFVQEARQKLRGGFFGSADLVYEEVNSTGTLLPFSDKSVGQRRIASDSSLAGSEDHPSVATWIIQPNGAVFLPEGGLWQSIPSDRPGRSCGHKSMFHLGLRMFQSPHMMFKKQN